MYSTTPLLQRNSDSGWRSPPANHIYDGRWRQLPRTARTCGRCDILVDGDSAVLNRQIRAISLRIEVPGPFIVRQSYR